jgi:ABC-2 type transport system ATP-binding protein
MTDRVVELSELVKVFGDRRAVDRISLTLDKGEIVGILGPNGAGKSTTIRMIMNIIVPDSGQVTILGRPFCEELKNRLGYLPEERGLYRKMTVMETLRFFGRLKGVSLADIETRAGKWLERFSLTEHQNKRIEELSKGMAQKVQIIVTILHEPELLILDEPFSGLDPVNIELVRELILDMKRRGTSILFSTHMMDFAEKLVDRVIMIDRGHKVLDETLDGVRQLFGESLVTIGYSGDAAFVADLPFVKGCRDYGNTMEIELSARSHKDELLDVLRGRLDLTRFTVGEPSLNHIFFSRVSQEAS